MRQLIEGLGDVGTIVEMSLFARVERRGDNIVVRRQFHVRKGLAHLCLRTSSIYSTEDLKWEADIRPAALLDRTRLTNFIALQNQSCLKESNSPWWSIRSSRSMALMQAYLAMSARWSSLREVRYPRSSTRSPLTRPLKMEAMDSVPDMMDDDEEQQARKGMGTCLWGC